MEKLTLAQTIDGIEPASKEYEELARKQIEDIAMPPWALGKLCDLAVTLAGIERKVKPTVDKKIILTMAADHGVAEDGVSAFPQEVTVQMAQNILLGGAGVNVLGRAAGAEVRLTDMGIKEDISGLPGAENLNIVKIAPGSENMHTGPAMTREQAVAALEAGINIANQAVADGAQLLGTGDLGIGNTTPSAAILSVMADIPVAEATGRGTGVDDEGLRAKIRVIEESIELNKPDKNDAVDVLSKVGGYDIAGIAGSILGAAYNRVPIFIDGFISTAGALIALGLCPTAADYMLPSHRSQEPGHDRMWKAIGKDPLLDLNFRLGEGTGGAVAMHLAECACRIANDMLTFSDAGVTNADSVTVDTFADGQQLNEKDA